ncbi:MAG: hypothetical protein WBA63_00595 [Thermomicrobiales bacterium]
MHHRFATRIVAVLVLMLGLAPTLAPAFASAAAQRSDSGLIDETSYESPQFGYTVSWDAPWQTRARNVTSNPGGFDSLTLRDGSSNLRIVGRSNDDDLATVLDDSVGLELGNADDSEVLSESAGQEPFSAKLRVRTNTILIEVMELPENEAIVVVTLSARSDVFDDVLATTQDVVTVNDIPVLTGATGAAAGASPEATEAASPTGEASPTEEASPTGAAAPTDEAMAEASPTAERATTPEAQGTGVEGDTYTSPHYGYTFSWDESVWDIAPDGEISQDDPVYDSLQLVADTGIVYVYSWDGYEGDAAACLQGESDYYGNDDPGISDWAEAEDADGNPLMEVDGTTSAWGVYNLTYQDQEDSAAEPVELTDYIECRTLVPGKSILIIFASATRDSYNDHIDVVQDVIDTIDTSNASEPGPTTTIRETPEPDASPAATTGEIEGLSGSTFTSPSFGFVFEIPSAWSVVDASIEPNDETLTLDDGVSVVTVHATDDPAYLDSLPSCVDAVADDAKGDPAYGDLAIDRTGAGAPFKGSDDQSAYANYTYTASDGTTFAHFIECRYISEGESVLIVTQDVPYDQYTTERGARREIQNSIELP